eukprot:symbB.v1.2.020750.t1/scaffold1763.1/size102666/5
MFFGSSTFSCLHHALEVAERALNVTYFTFVTDRRHTEVWRPSMIAWQLALLGVRLLVLLDAVEAKADHTCPNENADSPASPPQALMQVGSERRSQHPGSGHVVPLEPEDTPKGPRTHEKESKGLLAPILTLEFIGIDVSELALMPMIRDTEFSGLGGTIAFFGLLLLVLVCLLAVVACFNEEKPEDFQALAAQGFEAKKLARLQPGGSRLSSTTTAVSSRPATSATPGSQPSSTLPSWQDSAVAQRPAEAAFHRPQRVQAAAPLAPQAKRPERPMMLVPFGAAEDISVERAFAYLPEDLGISVSIGESNPLHYCSEILPVSKSNLLRNMAEGRVYNFSAGPSVMPLEVLEEVQREMVNYKGCGMSVMEMSHRSKEFMAIAAESEKNLRDIFGVPSDYKVLMMQGGATLQFSTIPLNMLGTKTKADYLVTGQWGEKAHKECNKYGTGQLACNTKSTKFTTIPQKSEWKLDAEAAYVHYCANETVNGVEFSYTPDVGDVPLVADMSSNFCSKPIEVSKHAFIYAGIQKNLGPAGMAVGFLRPDFADGSKELKICPTYCSFKTTGDNGSMYNTPACFTMYVMGEYLKYTKKVGGLAYWAEQSDKKSGLLYGTIDSSSGFYNCPVEKTARSRMNVPFTINGGDEALEKKFLDEAKKHKLYTLAGHRSVGGCRASLYNGMPLEGVAKLTDFMKSFMDENRK